MYKRSIETNERKHPHVHTNRKYARQRHYNFRTLPALSWKASHVQGYAYVMTSDAYCLQYVIVRGISMECHRDITDIIDDFVHGTNDGDFQVRLQEALQMLCHAKDELVHRKAEIVEVSSCVAAYD